MVSTIGGTWQYISILALFIAWRWDVFCLTCISVWEIPNDSIDYDI